MWQNILLWDQQWENQTVLWGCAPKDSLITFGTSIGKLISEKLKAFPLFVRRWGSKTEEDAAEGLAKDNHEGGFRLSLGHGLNVTIVVKK